MKPKVLILAGGVGKRFYPFSINKTLLPLFGKTLIEHTIDQLVRIGLNDTLIAANAQNVDFLSNYHHKGIKIKTRLQPEATGMADAVLLFENELSGQPVIIMNAIDTVDDVLFIDLLKLAEQEKYVVAGWEYEGYFPGGYLVAEGDRAISLIEKPDEDKRPSNVIKLVVDYYNNANDLIDQIKATKSSRDDVYELALGSLMKSHRVALMKYSKYWQALKYPFHILDVMEIYLKHRLKPYIDPTAYISKSASIEGPVYIAPNAKVFNNASVKGPVFIGEGAIVGDNALVRDSVVESGAVIGFGSEVTRSYIGPKCMLHHNFVGDSILESNVNPSYGTCFTNMRFDGKSIDLRYPDGSIVDTKRHKFGAIVADSAFLGANSTVLPGRMIGAHKNTPPGSVVTKNLLDLE